MAINLHHVLLSTLFVGHHTRNTKAYTCTCLEHHEKYDIWVYVHIQYHFNLKLAGINIHNVVISTALCVAKRSFKDVNPPMTSSSVMSVQYNHIRSDYIELCSAGEINSC